MRYAVIIEPNRLHVLGWTGLDERPTDALPLLCPLMVAYTTTILAAGKDGMGCG